MVEGVVVAVVVAVVEEVAALVSRRRIPSTKDSRQPKSIAVTRTSPTSKDALCE